MEPTGNFKVRWTGEADPGQENCASFRLRMDFVDGSAWRVKHRDGEETEGGRKGGREGEDGVVVRSKQRTHQGWGRRRKWVGERD